MSFRHERRHYRIEYPRRERPHFLTGERSLEVIDLCETGFRYAPGEAPPPRVGDAIQGRLRFRTGEEVEVQGTVVRIQEGVAVRLDDCVIPFAIILAEQQYLRLHYYR